MLLQTKAGLVGKVSRFIVGRSVVNGIGKDVTYAVVADDKGTQIYNLDHYRTVTETPDGGDAA